MWKSSQRALATARKRARSQFSLFRHSLDTSEGLSRTARAEALTAFEFNSFGSWLVFLRLMCPSVCPSAGLHLSDRVWPHVSWSTTMSVDRNRQAAWKPAFLQGPRHWQLRPSRTTSNVTRCWHFLSSHSLPSLLPFRTPHFHYFIILSWSESCVWASAAGARLHMCKCRVADSFLHRGSCCLYVPTSLRTC